MRRFVAVLMALLVAAPVHAQSPIGIRVWDPTCSCFKNARGDAAGVQLVAPAYNPSVGDQTIVSAVSLDGNECNYSNPLTATLKAGIASNPFDASSSHLPKWARVLVTGTAADSINAVWNVRFYGSMDGVTYAPIIRVSSSASSSDIVFPRLATTRPAADTLKVRGYGPMNLTGSPVGSWFPLSGRDGTLLPHKFIIAVCSVDTTSTLVAPCVFTVQIVSREQ